MSRLVDMRVASIFILAVIAGAVDEKSCLQQDEVKHQQVLIQSKVTSEIVDSVDMAETDDEGAMEKGATGRLEVQLNRSMKRAGYQLGAVYSKVGTIVKDDLLDIDKMAKDLKKEAAAKVRELTRKVNGMSNQMKKAKKKFKADRKAIRSNFKKCKKVRKHWKTKSECAPFKPHLSMLEVQDGQAEQEGEEEEQEEQEEMFAGGRRRKADKTPTKKELRQAKREAKRAAKDTFKNVKKSVRDYKKQLRQAKFQKNVLPKMIILLKPQLIKALGQVDMSDDSTGQLRACEKALAVTEEEEADCIPLAEINVVSLLKNYMNVALNSALLLKFHDLFTKIKEAIWKIFDPPVQGIKESLVASVGSIPAVGGMLAVAVGVIFDVLYKAIKFAVEYALDMVSLVLRTELVKGIVNAVFATGLFDTDSLGGSTTNKELGNAMKNAGDSAQKSIMASSQKSITDEATSAKGAAKQAALGQADQIEGEGVTVENEENQEDKADEDEEEAEDKADIDDDED